ncbi:MAG: hypothetical protein EXS63_05185 [Candidatus Omnitrophica bacterium]|nr:hypothetical protein [Candidatus Omnitrophota bacterium]
MQTFQSSDSITLAGIFRLIKKHLGIYLVIVAVSFTGLFLRIKSNYHHYHIRQNFLLRGENSNLDMSYANQLRNNLETNPEILDWIMKRMKNSPAYTLDQLRAILTVKIWDLLDDYLDKAGNRVHQYTLAFSVRNSEEPVIHGILDAWSEVAVQFVEERNQNARDQQIKLRNALHDPDCTAGELTLSQECLVIRSFDKKLVLLAPVGRHETFLTPSSFFIPALTVAFIGSLLAGILFLALLENCLKTKD